MFIYIYIYIYMFAVTSRYVHRCGVFQLLFPPSLLSWGWIIISELRLVCLCGLYLFEKKSFPSFVRPACVASRVACSTFRPSLFRWLSRCSLDFPFDLLSTRSLIALLFLRGNFCARQSFRRDCFAWIFIGFGGFVLREFRLAWSVRAV